MCNVGIVRSNQLLILAVSLCSVLVLLAAGVYFFGLSNETPQGGDMMGTGAPSPLYSLVVAVILIAAAVAIGIGLIAYFVYPTISRATKSQVLTRREEKGEHGRLIIQKSGERVATGYTVLDRLLYDGIPNGFAVAVTSSPCKQRDSLIRNYLETGTVNGEITLYVTTNPKSASDLATRFPNFYLIACYPQPDATAQNASNISTFRGVEDLTGISINLTRTIRNLPESAKMSKRICIDILSDVLLQHGSVQTRKWLAEILTLLRSAEFTTLAFLDPEMHSSEEMHAVVVLFDGEINISEVETAEGLQRLLKIKRMNNQEYMEDEILL